MDYQLDKLMEMSQKLMDNEHIVIKDKNIKDADLQGVFFAGFSTFAYMMSRYARACDFFKVIASGEYPGMYLFIVPVNSETPDNSIEFYIDVDHREIDKEVYKKFDEYVSIFYHDTSLRLIYNYIRKRVSESLKNENIDIRKI